MQGNDNEALQKLDTLANRMTAALDNKPNNSDAAGLAYAMISAGILAQRMHDTAIATKIIQYVDLHPQLLKAQTVGALFKVLLANQQRVAGNPDAAVMQLKPLMDGSEPFQAHTALMEAYADSKQPQKAVDEAHWLTRSRGRAYAEFGCGWCQQSLNVADTTLGHLRAAELLAGAGHSAESRRELQRFDSSWDSSTLPDHLRVRREAVLATFN
jgi:lipopolysaccharide biosynthesis regulator YciM